ncbi:hypothetical protein DL766_009436 [Monosporascus sp. MC13-8B]|uniref:Nephrocystin 3-like N-terminal domain-containing protein n=1 Tax=Monosporascus cannonballus TaxID=155416 RepID=A0ABY0H8W0_9PEZI|nr:hypothetical protein DL762_005116 [Monosporascus cannonballus]RYP00474.1 hypothetical protein DL763_000826 [Monosporascus cannonballus]RYP15301.1 hypothetical protein DL766_009436 [Monosporascus sp. MC13-8B]
MQGLRRVSQSLRKRTSTGSSHSSRKPSEERKVDSNMAGVHLNGGQAVNGSQGSLPTQGKGDTRSETKREPIEATPSEVENTESLPVSSPRSDEYAVKHPETVLSTRTTRVVETAKKVERKIVYEVEDVEGNHFERVDLQRYLDHIGDEREKHMPYRGSQWDRVLKEAEFFGLMLADFAAEVSSFVPNSVEIQDTALASCYLLLEKLEFATTHITSRIYARIASRRARAERTCEWFEDDLIDFVDSDDSLLAVTGSAGCGKSMLAAWVRERLERPIGYSQQKHETIGYSFSSDNLEKATAVAFLQSLLSQLLYVDVGDTDLFHQLSGIFAESKGHNASKTLENDLWRALDSGLATLDKRGVTLTIIVDSLDETVGGVQKASEIYKRLYQSVKQLSTRAVTFSRHLSHLGEVTGRHLVLTPDHNREDIRAYLHENLSRVDAYMKQSEANQVALVNLLTTRAKGSFLFAYLALELLRTGLDFNTYHKTIESIKSDTNGILEELVAKVNLKDAKLNRLFSFIAVAERPLTVGELDDLLRVDLAKRSLAPSVDIRALLPETRGLVVEHSGFVRFKHSVIRSYVVGISGKSLPSLEDAHRQLVMAMLLFAKSVFLQQYEPSFETPGENIVQHALRSHSINRYILEKWIYHFKLSSFQSPKGELILTSDFKNIFPNSTFFVLLEWSITQSRLSVVESIQWHELALKIRFACFEEKHPSVLQSLVILGSLYRMQSNVEMMAEYFYRAAILGRSILFEFSPLVVTCTKFFLRSTEKIEFTERTTIVSYREEMIRYIIEVYKTQYGAQSDAVIRWYKKLAKLYMDIHEKKKAALVYKELHELIIIRHGRLSDEGRDVARELAELQVVLQKEEPQQVSEPYGRLLLEEASEEMDMADGLRITIILNLAESYEAEGKLLLAERLYITLWRRISEVIRSQTSTELKLVQINIALKYAYFLKRLKRTEEASNILICVWAEYENQQVETESIIVRLKEISLLFKSFGMATVSLSILRRVWGWYKERKMIDSEEAISTTVTITEVVEESIVTVTETTTTTTVTESLVHEVFETIYASSQSGKITQNFYGASSALVSLHIKHKRWNEAEIVLRRSLELVWKDVLTNDEKIMIKGSFISERIQAATRLAICYERLKIYEMAEQIYINLYRACLTSLDAKDVFLRNACVKLVGFYEERHRHEKAIEAYTRHLQHYHKHLGRSHAFTVQILYKLASLHLLLGQQEAYDYYGEIVTIHTKDGVIHHDAFDAARIVFEYRRERKHWAELKALCSVLWKTVVHSHQQIIVSEEFMQSLYEQYSYVLETQASVEFSVLYKLAVEYRETVRKIFSAEAEIIIMADIALAEICEKSEEHHDESICIYEEIITKKRTVTTVTETKVHTIKKRLSKLYVTVVTSGKKTETQTVERGITVTVEIYEQLKTELGWWHETTLHRLMELVLLYQRLNTEKSRVTITTLLQESVIKIITTVSDTMTLYRVAITLASIYKTVGQEHQAEALLHQVQFLILFPGFETGEQITVKLDAKVGRVVLVFFTAFEEEINAGAKGTITFSQLMADLLLETILYEQYTTVITSKSTEFKVVLEHAARLRCLWVSRGRVGLVKVLDQKLFALFTERYSKYLGSHANNTNAVFDLYEALLFEIGDGASADRTTSLDFGLITCKAVNAAVRKFMVDKKDMSRAHAVAECGFQFADAQRFYHEHRCGVVGYRLAEMLAGREVPTWNTADAAAKESLLGTSRRVLQTVLIALREANVDIVRLRFEDLSSLISLLGEQKNYTELETLLTILWRSREVQRGWSTDTVLQVGSCLVDAHVFAGHPDAAINLCNTLYYNVRQSRGALDPHALDLANRLTILLKRAGRLRDAGHVHVDAVRDLFNHRTDGTANGGGEDNERLRAAAETHLDGMRRSGWATRVSGGTRIAKALQSRLLGKYGKLNVPAVEQWSAPDEKKEREVAYPGSAQWTLRGPEKKTTKRDSIGVAKEHWGLGYRAWKPAELGGSGHLLAVFPLSNTADCLGPTVHEKVKAAPPAARARDGAKTDQYRGGARAAGAAAPSRRGRSATTRRRWVKGARLLAINENGRVPALEDPDTGVVSWESWESGARTNHPRRVHDADGVAMGPKGKGERERAGFDEWEFFPLTAWGPMTGQTNWYRRCCTHSNAVKNKGALKRDVEQTERCCGVLEGQLTKTDSKR